MKVDIIGFLRSLSFGGLLGCGIAYLAFLNYPQLFVGHATLEVVVIFGSLLGACLHRAIDALVVKGLLLPFGRFADYYGKLVQLRLQKRAGLIDNNLYKQIKNELDLAYFLGPAAKYREDKRLLPRKEVIKN